MPIYEYRCNPCDRTFETLVRTSSDIARCPSCGNIDVDKEFSVPAAAQTDSRGGASLPVCGPSPSSAGGGCGMGGCGGGGGGGMCGLG
jgi:putative FmdB family regulatory protein